MTELDQTIIKEAITIYTINNSMTQNGLIITKYEQKNKSLFQKQYSHTAFADSKPVQKWKYHDSNLEEIELDDENSQPKINGIRAVTARFIYQEEENTMYLDVIFDPMFGRGYCFPVVEEDGKPALAIPTIVWMS